MKVISFAEHNGSYSVAYKNLFDWCSRITPKLYDGKPTIVLTTSPGKRGGKSVLELALNSLPRFGADIKASLLVPLFNENFDSEKGVVSDPDLSKRLEQVVGALFYQK